MGDHEGGASLPPAWGWGACVLGLTVGRKNSSHSASVCAFIQGAFSVDRSGRKGSQDVKIFMQSKKRSGVQ